MTTVSGLVRSTPIDDFLAGAGGSSAGGGRLEVIVLAFAVVMSALVTRSSIA